MIDIISFSKTSLCSNIYFRNLYFESREIQDAVRIWHNQKFVLNRIGENRIIGQNEHDNFIKNLDKIDRRHYVIYFKDNPVGKLSFLLKNNYISDAGIYLNDEKLILSGVGLLSMYAFLEHIFFDLNANRECFSVLHSNKKIISFHKRCGAKIINCDENFLYFQLSKEVWTERREKIGSLCIFLNELK